MGPIAPFWLAYVLTRPLGASIADWLGKPPSIGGLGIGDGPVAALGIAAFPGVVIYLARTGRDRRVQHVDLHLHRRSARGGRAAPRAGRHLSRRGPLRSPNR